MAEQTFKSPGFFDTEIVTERNQNLEQIATNTVENSVFKAEPALEFRPDRHSASPVSSPLASELPA